MRISIKYKIFFSFLITFTISFIIIFYFLNISIRKNNDNIIMENINNNKKEIERNIQTYFKENKIVLTTQNFENESNNINEKMNLTLENYFAIYSIDGKLLSKKIDFGVKDNLVKKVVDSGIINYSVEYRSNSIFVSTCIPIIDKENKIGLIYYEKEFKNLYESREELVNIVYVTMIVLLVFICLISFVFSRKITGPIIKLRNISEKLADGDFNVDIELFSNDEIGELADNLDEMRAQIQEHIEVIEKDREALKDINNYRKEFFDNVTHEMKTPLTVIQGYSQIIQEADFDDKEFWQKSLKHIENESVRLHRMVVDILTMSKQSRVDIELCYDEAYISDVLDIVCDEMSIKAMKYDISITKDIQDDVVLFGSEDDLKSVVVNLIDNAIKYSRVTTPISVSLKTEGSKAIIIIEDKGVGIEKDKLDKVFEPFFRADVKRSREAGSCGLGMSIVKSIVENHKGEINIESVVNLGTKVTLIFDVFNKTKRKTTIREMRRTMRTMKTSKVTMKNINKNTSNNNDNKTK